MAKHKVSELEGALLDAAVAKAEGLTLEAAGAPWWPRYTTDWCHGGPIIERERIAVAFDGECWCAAPTDAEYESYFHLQRSTGSEITAKTPLIAAMRAYVASKFGGEVELP